MTHVVLMDTVFLIDLMRGRERAVALLEDIEREDEPIAVSTTTLQEFFRGLGTLQLSPSDRRRVIDAVRGRPILPLDAAAAERAGQIDAELWARGEPLDPEDAALAGVALSRDEPVATRRVKELGRVAGLRLRPY